MKEGITKLQAVCITESLVIVVHQDKELMETVLKLYTTQIERIQEHCKKDEEYNLLSTILCICLPMQGCQ
jgi:hypothetical protein